MQKIIRIMKRTNIVGKARMLRRNCSAESVCLNWAPPTIYVKNLYMFYNFVGVCRCWCVGVKVIKHVKILVMRAALKLSIQLKRTIS